MGLRIDPSIFPKPGFDEVVTRTDPYGPVEVWPVGAVDGPVHESVLRRFVAQVHRPRQAMDTYLRSHLVYSGAEPGEDVQVEVAVQIRHGDGPRIHSVHQALVIEGSGRSEVLEPADPFAFHDQIGVTISVEVS